MHTATPVYCTTYFYPNSTVAVRHVAVATPTLTSPYLPTMNVSWQPVLYRYYSSGWAKISSGPQLWGSTAFGSSTATQDFVGWNVSAGNVWYHVNIVYRWYWNGSVYHTETDNTSTHITQSQAMQYSGIPGYVFYSGPTGSNCLMT